VLCDPFAGSCALSLSAKLNGYQVLAGDISPRAEAIAQALLVNDSTQLEPADVMQALKQEPDGWYIPAPSRLPWPESSLRMLAGICQHAESYHNRAKRALLRAWAIKCASHLSLYGQPRMTAHQRIRDQHWDALTPAQVARILVPQTHPREIAQRCAVQMYDAAFFSGWRHDFCRSDVLELLAGRSGDVLLLDPPWPGTEAYGRNYHGVDELLENRELPGVESRFSASDGWRHLDEVFAAAEGFGLVVLMLGGECERVNGEQLAAMGREHGRKVEILELPYRCLRSRRTAKSDRKREWVLWARK
jgi:hypothetical protein